jgi:hypothetical protein
MKISVYIPKDLEEPFRDQAKKVGESPSIFLQSLLRERLGRGQLAFSEEFAALAGSWEDTRSAAEIVREIEESRGSAQRPSLT